MAKTGYILIPDDVMAREDLTFGQKCIMGVLARLQGDNAWCFPSFDYISKVSGVSRRQVIRLLNDLRKRQEIIVVHHHHAPSTYSVPWATARALRKKWAIQRQAEKTA